MGELVDVVHVIEATFAGVGRHVLDLATTQSQRGANVHVIYGTTRESESFRRERQALTAITWHPAELARGFAKQDLPELRRLDQLLKTLQPTVIHGHSTKGGLVARSLAHRCEHACYTPNALYSMNPLLSSKSRLAVGAIEHLMSYRTNSIVAVSLEEQLHLDQLRISAKKVSLVPNGVGPFEQTPSHEVRNTLGLPLDVPIVGFVGRLDEQKAPLTLIDVCAQVAQQQPDVHFAIVGDGPLRGDVERHIKTHGHLDGRIHLLGEQPGRWAMGAFDVFLLPSRYEGFPFVLVEAAAAGLPIVTTDRACASGIVDDGQSGRIVAFDQPSKIAAAVTWALAMDPEVMAGRAQTMAQEFTLEAMADLPYKDRLTSDH